MGGCVAKCDVFEYFKGLGCLKFGEDVPVKQGNDVGGKPSLLGRGVSLGVPASDN